VRNAIDQITKPQILKKKGERIRVLLTTHKREQSVLASFLYLAESLRAKSAPNVASYNEYTPPRAYSTTRSDFPCTVRALSVSVRNQNSSAEIYIFSEFMCCETDVLFNTEVNPTHMHV